uniref:RING-type domain-containing protein n=1 Tax=Eutreptiella gymnastica TaxID=73025 RepID=A0A7S1I8W4_9EUGL
MLEKQLEVVQIFFEAKERELSQKLQMFERNGVADEDAPFVELCAHLDRLQEYVLVNYLAVRKIVKKHDKLCQPNPKKMTDKLSKSYPTVASDAAQLLSRCTFYKCSRLAATLKRMERLLASIFVGSAHKQCGVCSLCCRKTHHVISPPCGHRFCWACFSTDMLRVCESCVVCGTQTGLDPASFRVDRLLTFAGEKMGYNPAQTPKDTKSWLLGEADKTKYDHCNVEAMGNVATKKTWILAPQSPPSSLPGSPTRPSMSPTSSPRTVRGGRGRVGRFMRHWPRLCKYVSNLWQRVAMHLQGVVLGSAFVGLMMLLVHQNPSARGNVLIWNAIYITIAILLHVFVAPVTHSAVSSSPTASYILFTKVVHFWLLASFVAFHLPIGEMLSIDLSDASSLLFPLCALNAPGLLAWDFLARRGYFRLSYARNFLETSLNCMILSALCAFHSHYCTHVDGQLSSLTLCPNLFIFNQTENPITTKLVGFWLATTIIYLLNYWFHRRRGMPGILWGGELRIVREHDTTPIASAPTDVHRMVSWYSMVQFSTAVNLLVSMKLFLGRFDIRVLHNHSQENERIYDHFADRSELWFDFAADVGDGFHSSYEVARNLAQPSLDLRFEPCSDQMDAVHSEEEGETVPLLHPQFNSSLKEITTLPRGPLLILGGDLAYPAPNEETYTQRFMRPFEDALPPSGSERRRALPTGKPSNQELASYSGPQAFAIPGNHDWYDGLEMFLRTICSSKWLGGWLMPQTTSYWAMKLPHGWWVFGCDTGLGEDIDVPQFQYFTRVAETHLKPDDKVIVITHEPAWVIDYYFKKRTQRNVNDLILYVLGSKCALRLSGDLHHYTRHVPVQRAVAEAVARPYSHPEDVQPQPVLVVSGGGGAFLHPTHVPRGGDLDWEGQGYTRVGAYPPPRVSRRYGLLNVLRFRQMNWQFDLVGGGAYFLLVNSLFPLGSESLKGILEAGTWWELLLGMLQLLWTLPLQAFQNSWCSLLVATALFVIFIAFVDSSVRQHFRLLLGISHALVHVTTAIALAVFLELAFEVALAQKVTTASSEDAHLYRLFNLLGGQLPCLCSAWDHTPEAIRQVVRTAVSIFDILEYTVVLRNRMLVDGRLDTGLAWLYYGCTFLLYYVLATPCVSFIFGVYLFTCVTFLGCHWDTGFSSLQIEHYKNFIRLHIRPDGDLEVFAIGINQVPAEYRLDPKWGALHPDRELIPGADPQQSTARGSTSSVESNGTASVATWDADTTISFSSMGLDSTMTPPSHTWAHPSRWMPCGKYTPPKIVDHFIVRKHRESVKW